MRCYACEVDVCSLQKPRQQEGITVEVARVGDVLLQEQSVDEWVGRLSSSNSRCSE